MFTLSPITRTQLSRRNAQLNDVYHLMNSFFNDDFYKQNYIDGLSLSEEYLRVDIQENEKEYIIEAEVPGVNREDINIDYKDQYLIIEVNTKKENEETKDNYIRRERSQKSCRRTFLMADLQNTNITAKLDNGVLKIFAPKVEKVETSFKIEVQ